MSAPLVGIVMGSSSDWETMKAAAKMLEEFGVPYEAKAMSAHRTPQAVAEWATNALRPAAAAIQRRMERPRPAMTAKRSKNPGYKLTRLC